MPQDVFIGIDLGGTRVRAASMDSQLNIIARSETLTLDEEGQDAVIGRMIAQAKAVWPTNGDIVRGVGVSAPGPLNPDTGILVAPPNLQGWHNVPLAKLMTDGLGAQTYLGNDANLAALAEASMGAARGYKDVVFLTISTGIGGGFLIDDVMLVGNQGLGAEAGHIIMMVEDRVSSFEKEASGTALARQAREAIKSGEKSSILDMAKGDIEEIKGYMVGEAAKAGDALGLKLIKRCGTVIGLGIVSLLHLFNPQIVVIGGGVAEGTWDLLNAPMHEAIEKYSLDADYWRDLKIVQASLGGDVSVIGAGALAVRQSAKHH
jgi:glucokinase